MNPPTNCPGCNLELQPHQTSIDYVSGESFETAICSRHKMAFTQMLPQKRDRISKYYGNSYYGEAGKRFSNGLEALIRAFRAIRVREMTRAFATPGRALDVGCGRGLTLSMLKAVGWSVEGTEFAPELAHAAQVKYGIHVHVAQKIEACNFAANSFDLISIYHVLEHFEAPFDPMREMARILKPGGLLFVEVPNLESWQAGMSAGSWFHLDVPRHQCHLSSTGLCELFQAMGLEIVATSTHSLEYGYYGALQSMLNRCTGQMNNLYQIIRRNRTRKFSVAEIAVNLLLAVLVGPFALFYEVLAVVARRGAVIKVVARKPLPQ